MAEADELIDEIFSQFLSEPPSPRAAAAAAGGDRDDDINDPTISISHLPDIITALELDASYGAVAAPTKHAAIKKALDPTACGRVRRQTFREIVPFLMEESIADDHDSVSEDPATTVVDNNSCSSSTFESARASKHIKYQVSRESVYQDFLLFTEGQDRPIVLADLKRVSAELKDNAPVELLTNMMQLKPPSGSGSGGNSDPHSISFAEFEYIMRMAKSI